LLLIFIELYLFKKSTIEPFSVKSPLNQEKIDEISNALAVILFLDLSFTNVVATLSNCASIFEAVNASFSKGGQEKDAQLMAK
jgi:hypothetical protein